MTHKKALGVLFLTVFVDLLGFGIIIPLLPFYAEHFSATPFVVTLLMATYSLLQFVFSPIWGRLSDRWGRRPILMVSLGGAAVAYTWFGLAGSLWTVFAARALAGAMGGNIAAAQAYIADVTTPENRARGMGMIGAAFGLGFIFGPALGGVLAGGDIHALNFALPAFVAAGLSLLALVFAALALPESLDPQLRQRAKNSARQGRLASLLEAAKQGQVGLVIGLFFLVTFAFSGMESTFAMWSERQFSWGPQQNGYLFAFAGVMGALIQGVFIGRLTRRFGEVNLLKQGALALALGLFLVPLSSQLSLLILAMVLMAYGLGVSNPSLNSLVSRKTSAERQGSALGLTQSASSLARIVGPVWAGMSFSAWGRAWPFFSGALVMLVVWALSLTKLRLKT